MIWDALTDLWDWFADLPVWAWFIPLLLAVLNRRIQAGIDRIWDWCSTGIRRWFQARTKKREQRRAAAAATTRELEATRELERLQKERVGRLFLQRFTRDDPGMIGKVVALDAKRRSHVIVVWENPPGRTPTEHDSATGRRTSIDWRELIKPADQQRHRTASLILRSVDDEDGWVELEALEVTALPDGLEALLFPDVTAAPSAR